MDILNLNQVESLRSEIEFSDIPTCTENVKFYRTSPYVIRKESYQRDASYTSKGGYFVQKTEIVSACYFFVEYDYSNSFSERTKSLWRLGLLKPNINQIEFLPKRKISMRKFGGHNVSFYGITPLDGLYSFIRTNTNENRIELVKEIVNEGIFINEFGDSINTHEFKNENFEQALVRLKERGDIYNAIYDNKGNSIFDKETYNGIKNYISEDDLINSFSRK